VRPVRECDVERVKEIRTSSVLICVRLRERERKSEGQGVSERGRRREWF
jgi:hypothetical protein